MVTPAGYTLLGGGPNPLDANLLTVGEDSFPRELADNNSVTSTTGQLRLTYFTARKTEVSTRCRLFTGGTGAAATPTLCRVGVYEIASDGAGTLVAATANDTSLFAAAFTAYSPTWATPFTKVAGRRYAVAPLVVTAATAPTFVGNLVANVISADAPRIGGVLVSLADLPASFTGVSVAVSGNRPYVALLP